MASNDDVLTDEQIAQQLAHFRGLEAQRTTLRREVEQRQWKTFMDEVYRPYRYDDFLYHNDWKGQQRVDFERFLNGIPSIEEQLRDEERWPFWCQCAAFKQELRADIEREFDVWKRDQEVAKHRKVYAFSLTTPDSDASAAICEAAIKLFEQKSVPISEGECYLEYGSTGYLPHVHGWYETEHGGRVFTKVFKRVWPLWGEDRRHHTKFRGGYHELVKNPQAYNLYASAEQRLIVRKRKSEALVYGQTRPSSSSLAEAQPQEEASAQDAQNPACDHNQHSSDSGELLSDVE